MSETRKIIQDGLYVTLGSVLVFVFSYLFRILLAKNLSIEEYGLFYSIWNFLTFFLFFIYLGLDQVVVYYIAKYKVGEKYAQIKSVIISTLFFQLLSTTIFILLIFSFSSYLEVNYFRYAHSGEMLELMSLFLLFNVLGGISSYVLYGFQKMKTFSFYAPVQSFLYLVLVLVFLKLNFGVYSPIYAYLVSSILIIPLFLPFSLKTFPLFKYKAIELIGITKKLFVYGAPLILASISSRLILQTDTLMLTGMTSLKEVGLYNAALPLATLFTYFGAGVMTIIFPLFTELWEKGDKKRIELYLQYIYKYLLLLLIPSIVLLILFRKFLLAVMFGPEYTAAGTALIILLVSTIFSVFCGINFQSLSAFGQPKIVSKIVLAVAIFNVLLNYLLISAWGMNGAALAVALSYATMFIFSWRYLQKHICLKIKLKFWPLVSWEELKMVKGLVWKGKR